MFQRNWMGRSSRFMGRWSHSDGFSCISRPRSGQVRGNYSRPRPALRAITMACARCSAPSFAKTLVT